MRSLAQRDASRANGTKSRGPVTERGKRNSKLSRHIVLDSESNRRFAELLASLTAELRPRTLDVINRYETRYDRQFARSLDRLMKLKISKRSQQALES